ncbi:ABC-F family ATP-binding cassette domain-containing protein [Brevibacillus centrosporus]|uniref:ABC-F family ATP-binding cassette domain-containing protein n=1 Tax=Brevibacillus centrosporus TaxID=54910 RepID=UPI000F0A2DE6|nr:ABC-F family ATP-binding cassette domain-containing protein [Brevibacillus centrosporus]MEC2130999.1 ABC-F family ATP-binding cassette domain-containing protein [Brevibacillus centrosporus]RNB63340.1 ABC transporter ATP-binding protein [Brevibacillus centrosporus]GED31288.1 ABC transporter ATP-binding protein [Brevibacillus centrosporus]
MQIVTVENLSKSYGEKVLFDNISFHIGEQQRIGLIGVNGTGKSTLLKIIAGLDTADSGKIVHANRFHVEYLPQNPSFDEDSSILDQVFYGESALIQLLREYEGALADLQLSPSDEKKQSRVLALQTKMDAADAWESNTQAKTILTQLGLHDFTQKVGELSGGQRKRVAMARALIQPADLLILDEPTNHIDNETVEWLEEYLSRYKGALLLVTHDRYFLDRVTNRTFELDRGKLFSYEGNYATFLEKRAEREDNEAAAESKRQNLLRRELAWLRRGAKARTTKQKARVQRAEELRDRVVEGPGAKMDMALGASRLGKKVIELEQISKSYGDRQLIKDFSYIVLPGDRVGIIGPNGSGKSTLLNMLAGRIQPDAGTIDIGQTVKIAYYTQDSVEMNEKLRVIEYVKEAAEVIQTSDGESITASQMLERFLFSPHMQYTPISRLSGGERRRLYLLRTLMGEPNVLFLDEPTNDLDIQTLSILEDYLEQFPGAVITVSHDRYFLDRTVDHLFAFEGQGRIRDFMGNYSEYLEERRAQKAVAAPTPAVSSEKSENSNANRGNNRTKKLSYKDQKEWDEIEGKIAALEERSVVLKKEIAASGSDYGKIERLYAEEQQVASDLEATIERWAELSAMVEELEQGK